MALLRARCFVHVVMLSKALVVGAYQKKLEELARLPDLRLTALVPPFWQQGGHRQYFEKAFASNYDLRVLPMALNGHFHLHYYPGLRRLLRNLCPDVVHVDEEPYNFATAHAIWSARSLGARVLCFTWQNIHRHLPPPFGLLERYCLRSVDHVLAGNCDAVAVLRRKGYRGPVAVVPQFGVDPTLFSPANRPDQSADRLFRVGYLGRLVAEKGLDLLIDALALLDGEWRLSIAGSGPLERQLALRAASPDLAGKVTIVPTVSSVDVPTLLRNLDVLVLPSFTLHNWKEQFGRVLIEAMACEVAVIGSESGEIPNVIGDAGLVFPEGDVAALRACLLKLRDDPALRIRIGRAGRQRVLDHYTQAKIAEQTYAVYRELFARGHRP